MKLRLLPYLFTVFALFGLTGCFELEEKAHFNKNGSGSYQFTVDLAQLGSFINMMEAMSEDSEEAEKSPKDEIKEGFSETKTKLEKVRGISNIASINDEENFRFGFSFDFANVDALNNGMNAIFDVKKDGEPIDITFFSYKKGKLERFEHQNLEDIWTETNEDSDVKVEPAAFMKDFRYTTIYTFEEPIKNVSNQGVLLSPDRKTVTNSIQPFGSESETASLRNVIDF